MIINFEIPDDDIPVLVRSQLVALYRPRSEGLAGASYDYGTPEQLLLASLAGFLRQQALNQKLKEQAETIKTALSSVPEYQVVRDYRNAAIQAGAGVGVVEILNERK